MAENRMADVAALFGKKLGEEFQARIVGNKFETKCRFTANGFEQTVVDGLWHDNDAFLSLLLVGKAEIVGEKMTNKEWIQTMNVEDLTWFLASINTTCDCCGYDGPCSDTNCMDRVEEWLGMEHVETDDD